MVIAQNAWRRLGVRVDTLELEWAVFINQRVDKGDFDAVVLGWAMDLERRHLPALPLEPDRALPAQLRRLSEPEGRRPHGPHPPGVRRGPPDGDGPGAPPPDRGRPALHVPLRPPRRSRSSTARSSAWCGARTAQPRTCPSSRTGWARSRSTSTSGSRPPRPVLPPFRAAAAARTDAAMLPFFAPGAAGGSSGPSSSSRSCRSGSSISRRARRARSTR